MRRFWQGETAAIVNAMRATGNQTGVIAAWKDAVEEWAQANPKDPNAQAALAWLPHWQVKPFYTAEELAPIWPALAIAIGHSSRWPTVLKSAKRLEHELDYAGLPFRFIAGRKRYIVERLHFWKKATQQEMEDALV